MDLCRSGPRKRTRHNSVGRQSAASGGTPAEIVGSVALGDEELVLSAERLLGLTFEVEHDATRAVRRRASEHDVPTHAERRHASRSRDGVAERRRSVHAGPRDCAEHRDRSIGGVATARRKGSPRRRSTAHQHEQSERAPHVVAMRSWPTSFKRSRGCQSVWGHGRLVATPLATHGARMIDDSLARAVLVLVVLAGCGSSTPPATRSPPGRAGTGCSSDAECGPGLSCCYPCGVDGCENACMSVEPGAGCPAIP